jgi:hypothetical protein
MKTANLLIAALISLGVGAVADAQAAPLPANSPLLFWQPANRIVGVWEFQVQTFNCTTGVPGVAFRARSVFNVGGTLEDTNNRPQSTRGPAFGVWTYDPRSREHVTSSRLFRYNADGSSSGVNLVERTLKLSRDGDSATSQIKVSILGPNEELLATDCATQDGVRSL